MGREGEGWSIAMKTLTFERGATGGQAGGLARMHLGVNDVVELARRTARDGRPAIEDPFRCVISSCASSSRTRATGSRAARATSRRCAASGPMPSRCR
jgi:alkylation response protein AidB-like acyl-CoA dehydrogenase